MNEQQISQEKIQIANLKIECMKIAAMKSSGMADTLINAEKLISLLNLTEYKS